MAVRITRTGVGLIIGIIVVAGIVLTGLVVAKQRGEQARRDEAVKIAQQNLESQSQNGALNEGDTTTDKGNGKTSDNKDGATNNGDKKPEKTPNTSELPQTGPVDSVLSLVAVALLAFSVTSYVTSRHALLKVR